MKWFSVLNDSALCQDKCVCRSNAESVGKELTLQHEKLLK